MTQDKTRCNASPPNCPNNFVVSCPENHGSTAHLFRKKTNYKDLWASTLFWLHFLGFVFLSWHSIHALREPTPFGGGFIISAISALCISMLYYTLVGRFSSIAIRATFSASILFYFACAGFLFSVGSDGSNILGAYSVIFGIFSLASSFCWRSGVPFSTILLETVTAVTKKYNGIIAASVLCSILQIIYSIYVLFVVFGVRQLFCTTSNGEKIRPCLDTGKPVVFIMFSYFWVSRVIKTIVHVTAGGVFAAHYYRTAEGVPSSPTIGSVKRALSNSFGSICSGSLILGALRILFVCWLWIFQWKSSPSTHYNYYAYAQVAIYGKDYCTAAKDTWALIKDSGVKVITNNNLLGNVSFVGALLVGAINSLMAFFYARVTNIHEERDLCLYAYLIGFGIMLIFGEVIKSGTAVTLVALAEDPDLLAHTEPVLLEEFCQEYPQVVIAA